MPTSYPGGLDAFTNPAAADTLDNPPHDVQHADVNDAVEAIEAELGTDPSGTFPTVRDRVEGVEAALSGLVLDDIADVDVAAPTDGQVLTWDTGTALWRPETPTGGGGAVPSPEFTRPTMAHPADDEFDDGSLAPTWTHVQQASGDNWLVGEMPNVKGLHLWHGGALPAAAAAEALVKPLGGLSAPLTIEIGVTFGPQLRDFTMINAVFADGISVGLGTQVSAGPYTDDARAGRMVRQIARWTGYNTRTATLVIGVTPGFNVMFTRLVWVAANTFRLLVSADGVNWVQDSPDQSYAVTPTHMGILMTPHENVPGAPAMAKVWYFRVYEEAKTAGQGV